MQIYGPSQVHGAQPVQSAHGPSSAQVPGGAARSGVTDEVQISDAGSFVDQARSLPDIRADRVQEIRTELTNGTYDIESKLDLTVSRLLDEIG